MVPQLGMLEELPQVDPKKKKKKDAIELMCRTETGSQTSKNLRVPKRTDVGGRGREGWTGDWGWKSSKMRL